MSKLTMTQHTTDTEHDSGEAEAEQSEQLAEPLSSTTGDTTQRVLVETLDRLYEYKRGRNDAYNEVVERLLDVYTEHKDEYPELATEEIETDWSEPDTSQRVRPSTLERVRAQQLDSETYNAIVTRLLNVYEAHQQDAETEATQ